MRVFVIGGTGLVGRNLVERFEAAGHEVRSSYHTDPAGDVQLDKRDEATTRDAIESFNPDAIIDTAAFHAVDDCETDRDRAWRVNAAGTRNAAIAANSVEAHYTYLSTDYVFPGDPDETPYTESDPVDPLNYYARTKYAGEQAARIADESLILRPSVVYGLASDNFVTWVFAELDAGNEIGIVDDQVSRPTYAPDLAAACVDCVESGLTGLYHATGPESVSRYQFTRTLADAFDYDIGLISPISTEELGQTAPRPRDSSLDSSRIYREIGGEFLRPKKAFEIMYDARNSE